MTIMPEASKNSQPPYLTLASMEKLFNLVSNRKLDEVTSNYLKACGFGTSDSYLAISALRFLGLIEKDSNKTTEQIKKLTMQGNAKEKELEQILKNSYSTLFDRASEAFK